MDFGEGGGILVVQRERIHHRLDDALQTDLRLRRQGQNRRDVVRLLGTEQDRRDHPANDQYERADVVSEIDGHGKCVRVKNGVDGDVRLQYPPLLLVVVADDGIDDLLQVCFTLTHTQVRVVRYLDVKRVCVAMKSHAVTSTLTYRAEWPKSRLHPATALASLPSEPHSYRNSP